MQAYEVFHRKLLLNSLLLAPVNRTLGYRPAIK